MVALHVNLLSMLFSVLCSRTPSTAGSIVERPSKPPGTRRRLIMLLALLLVILPEQVRSQDNRYMKELVDKADRLNLHEERMWEILLHYKKTLVRDVRSKIDDPKFFLSPAGRSDPKAELEATIRNLFIASASDGTHIACRFPARFEWLTAALGIEASRLPHFTCTERDKALTAVDGSSAVLVFPVGHINSPASMFGHTLIRIDGSGKSNLISYAANYAATTTDTNGFVYAWKGLFGLYKGYYSMLPYYLKVKEYSDIEHRDIWEYRLKLSKEEVRNMLNHLWELQNIHSSYYFLDENCSYNLLFLLEAARPELRLTDRTGILVLPTHTIRIALESGIIENARYRPSQGTRILKMLSLLGDEQQRIAYDLAHAAQEPELFSRLPVPDDEKMKVLDLAAEYVQLRFARKELAKEAYSRLYLKLLGERSRLGAAPDGLYDIVEPSRPESGHGTTRIAVGGGVRRGRAFAEVEVQPEFHTLLDPDHGYLKGAQVKFLDTSLRYHGTHGEIRLQKAHLVDIFSIAPRNVFFRPFSWRVYTGFDREALGDGKDHLIYRLNTGGGYSYSSPFKGIWYGLGEVDVNAGDRIRARVAVGPGLEIGAVEQPADWWKMHLSARSFLYKIGDDRWSLKVSFAQNLRITRNNSVSVECLQEFVNSHSIWETGVLWNYYY